MSRQLTILSVVVFVLLVPCLTQAQANCWSLYDPPPGTCNGPDGCQGVYANTFCIMGCVSGTCNNDANSANCCGVYHFWASLYPDGQNSCSGGECGDIRARLAQRQKRRGQVKFARQQLKLSPKDSFLSYRPPRVIFLANSCSHVYEVFLENYVPRPVRGGM
jgi:hypothetical protein